MVKDWPSKTYISNDINVSEGVGTRKWRGRENMHSRELERRRGCRWVGSLLERRGDLNKIKEERRPDSEGF